MSGNSNGKGQCVTMLKMVLIRKIVSNTDSQNTRSYREVSIGTARLHASRRGKGVFVLGNRNQHASIQPDGWMHISSTAQCHQRYQYRSTWVFAA